jgi:hypothetical protein
MPTQLQQDILKELGIDQLAPQRQEELLVAMTEVLLKRLTLRILEKLSDSQRKEFDIVCSDGNPEIIQAFFTQNVPGYEKMIQEEINSFKQEMKETVDALLV